MSKNKLLGIMGGMGATAGVRFAQYVVDIAQENGAVSDADYPEFLLYNVPMRGMDERGIADETIVRHQLIVALANMQKWRCRAVVVACNTVHYLMKELKEYFRGTVVNMIDAACEVAVGANTIGVLSSETTKQKGLYIDGLGRHGVKKTILTTDEEQSVINDAIAAVIVGGELSRHARSVGDVVSNMGKRGAVKIIIGCTELPVLIPCERSNVFLINAGWYAVRKALQVL